MAWVYILLADVLEILWPFVMKWSLGYSKAGPMIVTALLGLPVGWLLGEALKHIPAGTVYAFFIGLGGIGVTVSGMLLFHEDTSWQRIASLCLVIIGMIGLKLYTPS